MGNEIIMYRVVIGILLLSSISKWILLRLKDQRLNENDALIEKQRELIGLLEEKIKLIV